jgi:DNA-3-methyladenine glycosylase II
MAKPSTTSWTKDDRGLMRADKVMRRLMEERGPIRPEIDRRGSRPDPYEAIARAIVGQQLSTRAARSIWEKLLGLFGGELPEPQALLRKRPQTLRKAGLSNAKVEFLRDLARRITDGRLDLGRLRDLPDEDVVAELIEVKGVGRWTAEMFLIFALCRPDVLPVHDLGIRAGLRNYHGLDELPKPSECAALCDPWRPHRTVAMWYLWRSLHAKIDLRPTSNGSVKPRVNRRKAGA